MLYSNMIIDLILLIKTVGYLGLFIIVFAESGLLIGFFLPGDSLLFTAGLLASSGFFNIFTLMLIFFIAAVTGDSVGYFLGEKYGPKIFNKKKSLFFNPEHVERSKRFFEKYGMKTIFLARFIPIIRTFAPVLAGVGKMNYKKFLSINIIGGFSWSIVMPMLGYFLGKSVPNIDLYILPIVIGIIVVSFIPAIKELRA